jgi:peptidoglycan/LPS O-acetylase OafA/YrhL
MQLTGISPAGSDDGAPPSGAAHAGTSVRFREDANASLNSLRLAFAAWLVIYHIDYAGLFPRIVSSMGYLGPSFFITLSGFIMTQAYLGPGKVLKPSAFWWSRFTRLYPLYLLTGLVMLPLAIRKASAHGLVHGSLSVLYHLAMYATMTQAWALGHALDVLNVPGWTVSCLAFFFLLFPVIGPRLQRLSTTALGWVLGASVLASVLPALAATLWMAAHGYAIPADDDHVFVPPAMRTICVVLHAFPLARWPEFIDGMVFAMLCQRGCAPTFMVRHGLLLGIFGTVILMLIAPYVPYLVMHNAMYTLPACFLIAGTMGAADGTTGGVAAAFNVVVNRPWLAYLGRISFSIYLVHVPIVQYALFALGHYHIAWNLPIAVLYTGTTIAVACLMHRLVEEQARTWLRRIDPAQAGAAFLRCGRGVLRGWQPLPGRSVEAAPANSPAR